MRCNCCKVYKMRTNQNPWKTTQKPPGQKHKPYFEVYVYIWIHIFVFRRTIRKSKGVSQLFLHGNDVPFPYVQTLIVVDRYIYKEVAENLSCTRDLVKSSVVKNALKVDNGLRASRPNPQRTGNGPGGVWFSWAESKRIGLICLDLNVN